MTNPVWTQRPERGSAWLIRLMFWIAMSAGRTAARALLGPIALFFWLRTPAARADSARYLSRVLGRQATARDTLRHYFAFSSVILDRVYFLGGRTRNFEVTVHNEAVLAEAIRTRTGAFLVGAHLGSFEALRAIGRQRPGLRVSMAMFEANARKLMSLLRAIDPSLADDIVPLGHVDSMLQIEERLARGDFVGFLADRSFGADPTLMVDFLGVPAPFPTGVFRMASVMRCPVISMAALYLGGNRYALYFDRLTDFTGVERSARKEAVGSAVRAYAACLETYCRRAPYNWFNFYDFWATSKSPVPSDEANA